MQTSRLMQKTGLMIAIIVALIALPVPCLQAQVITFQSVQGQWVVVPFGAEQVVIITQDTVFTVPGPHVVNTDTTLKGDTMLVLKPFQRRSGLYVVSRMIKGRRPGTVDILRIMPAENGRPGLSIPVENLEMGKVDSTLNFLDSLDPSTQMSFPMYSMTEINRMAVQKPVSQMTRDDLVAILQGIVALYKKYATTGRSKDMPFNKLMRLHDAARFDVLAGRGYNPFTYDELKAVTVRLGKDKVVKKLLNQIKAFEKP